MRQNVVLHERVIFVENFRNTMKEKCLCDSGKEFADCCQLIIERKKDAITAEQLMRSRYTAFTKANGNYLIFSHHSSTRRSVDKKEIEQWARSVQWIRLVVEKSTEPDVKGDATVEFRAFFVENGAMNCIHENSLFRKQNGIWKYVAGQHF